ncbi:MAG: sulfur carrier protein ThiS [Dysgonamonadaceae bacterium]|jgi:sulfur carrier protein|nr:sulfur carrier protein ThiS [Dysgonamonadaceae bacterium]
MNKMIITLNDKPQEVEANISLATLLKRLELKPEGIAVAIDYEVIPKDRWEETILEDKMELMLIHAVSGG